MNAFALEKTVGGLRAAWDRVCPSAGDPCLRACTRALLAPRASVRHRTDVHVGALHPEKPNVRRILTDRDLETRMSDVLSPIEPTERASSDARLEETRAEILRDGTEVQIRPIQRSDVDLERRFIEELSPRSRRFRFLDTISSPSGDLLRRLVELDATTDVAYVAVIIVNGQPHEIGVARFSALARGEDCEFAVAVSDAWQRRGLGTLLMQRLIEAARARGIVTMHSNDSRDNDLMHKFAEHLHFRHERDPDDATQLVYRVDVTSLAAEK